MKEGYTVNYILGSNRTQIRIECFEDYVGADNEVRIIDKIIDALDLQSLASSVVPPSQPPLGCKFWKLSFFT